MEAMKRKKVHTSADKIEADMLVEALKNNHISAYRQGCGSGGYMDIYAGNSIFGEEIYVDEQDASAAAEIIEEITGAGAELEIAPGDEILETGDGLGKRGMGLVLLLAGVLCLIGLILFSVLQNAALW